MEYATLGLTYVREKLNKWLAIPFYNLMSINIAIKISINVNDERPLYIYNETLLYDSFEAYIRNFYTWWQTIFVEVDDLQ